MSPFCAAMSIPKVPSERATRVSPLAWRGGVVGLDVSASEVVGVWLVMAMAAEATACSGMSSGSRSMGAALTIAVAFDAAKYDCARAALGCRSGRTTRSSAR